MGNQKTWSISLGTWGGLQVRVHCLFLLFAAFTLFLGWNAGAQAAGEWGALPVAGGALGVLFLSVLLHELGHYLGALRLGGDCSELVLGPLGGLGAMRPPLEPLSETFMHLAGPGVNVCVCLVSAAICLASGSSVVGLLNPIQPAGLLEGEGWLIATRLTFWINWVLLLVNLLPAFPFDGGRALRSGLLSISPEGGVRRASLFVTTLAKVTALGIAIAALILLFRNGATNQAVVPTWFALMMLAIFLYFSAKQESEHHDQLEEQEDEFGYDFSQGYTSLERTPERVEEPVGPVQRWLSQRKQARLERQRQIEEEEESRMDDILGRLHAHGLENLSEEDRSLLNRVSARYRFRQK